MRPALPTPSDLRATAATIAAAQADCGAIAWDVVGETAGKVDAWDHVECAMGLLVAGEVRRAEAAYDWLVGAQRADGTWPIEWRLDGGELAVVDAGADTNMCAYVAVGVWHHWLVRHDVAFVQRLWPVVDAAVDAVVALQLPSGGVSWAAGAGGAMPTALLTGSSSVHHALWCAGRLADLLGRRRPTWEAARLRLADAVRTQVAREAAGEDPAASGVFEDKSRWSMDWYYPVLGGALDGAAAHRRIAGRWDEFVVPDLGIHCVDDHPWVTGAETCELAIALARLGDGARATRLIADMQHLRDPGGAFHTGYVYTDGERWPIERSSWTGAAVLLAVDALTPGSPTARVFGANRRSADVS